MSSATLVKSLSSAVIGVLAFSSAALAQTNVENYVGLGVRTGLNDSTALVVDSKLKVIPLDQGSVSFRPAILIGDDLEGRLPLSFDLPFEEQFLFFGGGGFAYNFDDSDFDPMITGGVDMPINERLILNVEGNLIFKSNDTDAEIAASINWQF
ncbi:MAG: hypothetical protein AAF572_06340 [Cyanobacteria bacterium P01_B01_bin.77]